MGFLTHIGRYVRTHHVGLMALFVALGGTAYALSNGSVKTKHLANNAVTGQKAKEQTFDDSMLYSGKCEGTSNQDKMVRVGPTCIDKYEASVWSQKNGGDQYGVASDDYPCDDNGQDCKGEIYARSVPGVTPSRHITWFQAEAALTNSGKRLPANNEWQKAVQGTPDPGGSPGSEDCNTNSTGPEPTGERADCKSAYGAHDMVGNPWEWVAEWDEDAAGCETWSATYGTDATCMGRAEGDANNHGPGALLRGGYWSSGTDAGAFAVDAFDQPSGSFNSVGFRGAR